MNKKIRMATLDDAEAILNIYEPYILNTVITLECDKISIEDFKERMKSIMSKFPWLVYTIDEKVVGYAYCSPHYARSAYQWGCLFSVYVHEEYHRQGIASLLSNALFEIVKKQGFYNVYSLICVPNVNSVALHQKLGFKEVGTYYKTAYKLGQWRDVLIMEKRLREPEGEPEEIIPANKIQRIL